ncbi:hypothetical protein NQ317_002740 [Molorchus minor]|uniref:Peptidase S1 domain-containing protein n=1 Tax=Molorchus minor TaxID=1323400 RepID=A0ABQ9K3K3_9CUCU|nr:hypothetical protein NQ317_002740 [Molorchus minor]
MSVGNTYTFNFKVSPNDGKTERGLLTSYLVPANAVECGIPNREARLLGGEYTKVHEFPWAALIQIRDTRSVLATLINDKFLITAASNLLSLTPLDIKVTVGQFDRCFPDVSSMNMSIRNTWAKWLRRLLGPRTKQKEGPTSASCRPRKLGLPVLSRTECLGAAFESKYASNDKGCIGIVGLSSPVCKIDAGGPVMFRSHQGVYELIGVLTDINLCNINEPSVALYTSINNHLFWITQNTRDACYCFKT